MRGTEVASEPATPTPPPSPSLPPPPAAPEENGIHEFEQLELSRLVDLQTRSILQPLDDNIVQVIEAGCIRLVDANWLRDTDIERMSRRQDLEAMHTRALLPPAKGAALILKGEREVTKSGTAFRRAFSLRQVKASPMVSEFTSSRIG